MICSPELLKPCRASRNCRLHCQATDYMKLDYFSYSLWSSFLPFISFTITSIHGLHLDLQPHAFLSKSPGRPHSPYPQNNTRAGSTDAGCISVVVVLRQNLISRHVLRTPLPDPDPVQAATVAACYSNHRQ